MQEDKQQVFDFNESVNHFILRRKRWDTRADGRVFWQYTDKLKSKELWVTLDSAIRLNESVKKAASKQRSKNPEKHKLQNKQWRTKNKEKHRQNARDYYQNNKLHANEVKRKRRMERRFLDPLYAFKEGVRSQVNRAFRDKNYTKNSKTKEILGCEWSDLSRHIESQFVDGMGWNNRNEWHVDHIVPLASAKTMEDIVLLNHYTNLQPLWALDNLKKGASIL
jgi:hypothetical protein